MAVERVEVEQVDFMEELRWSGAGRFVRAGTPKFAALDLIWKQACRNDRDRDRLIALRPERAEFYRRQWRAAEDALEAEVRLLQLHGVA